VNHFESWDSFCEYVGDAEASLAEQQWYDLLAETAESDASLALRLLLRRLAVEVAADFSQSPAFAVFGSEGREEFLIAGVRPSLHHLFLLEGGSWQIYEITGTTSPVKLLGLDKLPVSKVRRDDLKKVAVSSVDVSFRMREGVAHTRLGRLRKALQITSQYMEQRRQGGRVLKGWSEPRRLLRSLEEGVNRLPPTQIVSHCMDLMGGAGYMREFKLEEIYREIFTLSLCWGTKFE
jgi:hypothetical protein